MTIDEMIAAINAVEVPAYEKRTADMLIVVARLMANTIVNHIQLTAQDKLEALTAEGFSLVEIREMLPMVLAVMGRLVTTYPDIIAIMAMQHARAARREGKASP